MGGFFPQALAYVLGLQLRGGCGMSSQNPTGLGTSNLHDWPSSILLVCVGLTPCPDLEGLARVRGRSGAGLESHLLHGPDRAPHQFSLS